MMKMDARVKGIWLDALLNRKDMDGKSTRYKQGKDLLYDPNARRYCCLGVLTREYIKDQGITDSETISDLFSITSGTLNPVVSKWAGLRGPNKKNPVLRGRALSFHNDSTDVGFVGIADMIEKEL